MNKFFFGFLVIIFIMFLISLYIITWKSDNNTIDDEVFNNLYLNNFIDEKNIPSQQDE